MLEIEIKLLNDHAKIPTKSYEYDAGWDLYSSENCTVRSGQRNIIKTGISIAIPQGWVGLIWPRSGLSVKSGIDVLAGVIDCSYRGEIMVCLYNTSSTFPTYMHKEGMYKTNDLHIKTGDRIAQVLFQEVPRVVFKHVSELDSTGRGDGGFGSSGR